MEIVKQSVARDIPCLLIQSSDGQSPLTGQAAGTVTITYRKEGASTWSSKTASGNWTEITPGKGAYLISWSTGDLDTVGRFDFVVEHASCINYYGSLVVSANLLDDLGTTLAALNDVSANDVRDAILDDATRFSGADIDDAITSRSSHAAADVVALLNNLSAADVLAAVTNDSVKWDGADIAATLAAVGGLNDLAVTDILSDSTAFAGANIAAIVSAIAGLNDPSAAEIEAAIAAIHGAGNYEGAGAAPTVAQIAEAVHDVKVTFTKTTGGLVITMADDTPLTSVTITDTSGEVTRE